MNVIVCGAHDYKDAEKVFAALDRCLTEHGVTKIIHDGRGGAAALGASWAVRRNVENIVDQLTTIERKKCGAAVVQTQNKILLDRYKPGRVVRFGDTEDSADMVDQARARGVRCIEAA